MKIAIVNDETLIVEGLRRVLADHEIAWTAYDGAEAVQRCIDDKPDLILMDLIMPVMDGVTATQRIMATAPCAILIVTATVAGNASKVFQAMGAGALDAVNTPVLGMTGDGEGRDALLSKIETIRGLIQQKSVGSTVKRVVPAVMSQSRRVEPLVVIGASSGGPHALAQVLSVLPEDFSSPVVIVQHVDPYFSPELAQWLDQQCALNVRLAEVGDRPKSGEVLVAKGGSHLLLTRGNRLSYTSEPVEQAYCPSVDIFFNSVAEYCRGEAVVGVLLTGMGRDGAQGLLHLKNKGAYTIAQTEASCAVYGMPKAAVQLNAATDVLSMEEIGLALKHYSFNGLSSREAL